MTPYQIASGLVSFQTLCFKYDDNTIMVVSKERNENFQALMNVWIKKYKFKGGNYGSMEMDGVEMSTEESKQFFIEYPQLKKQLEINEKYGYEIWIELPEGLKQSEIDIIHTDENE